MDRFFKIVKVICFLSILPSILLLSISIAHGFIGFVFSGVYYKGLDALVNSFIIYFAAYYKIFIGTLIVFIITLAILILKKIFYFIFGKD